MSVNIEKGSSLSFHSSKTVEQAKIANDNGIYFAHDNTTYGTIMVNGKIFGTSNSNYLSSPTSGDLYDFIVSQGAAGEGAGANALSEAKKYTDDSINALDATFTSAPTKYVSVVTQTNGKINVTHADLPTLSSLGGITPATVDSKISTAINNLDVTDTAVAGKYVSAVSEANGKITVSRANLPTIKDLDGITPEEVDAKISYTIGNLKAADSEVENQYVSSVSEANGIISVRRKNLPTLSDLGGITPTSVDSKITTAISNLNVTDAAVTNQYVSAVSEANGKITVSRANLPTLSSLGGVDGSYVETKISNAIGKLNVTDSAVTNQYVSAVSEANGKITVSRANLPTLEDLDGITPEEVDTKITTAINNLDATVSGNSIKVFTYTNGAVSNYSSTPKVVETNGKLTSLTVLSQATNLVTKEYVDHMHTILLGDGNLKDTVDTITEISYWLDNDLNDGKNLTLSLAQLTSKVENNEEVFSTAISDITSYISDMISGGDVGKRVQIAQNAYTLYETTEGNSSKPVYFSNGSPKSVTSIDNTLISKTAGTSTLSWGTEVTLATIAGQAIKAKLPANPNIDTKNTAGSTNTSSKLFLVGTTSQTSSSQTYSHDTVYVGTDGCLYSNNKKVITVTEHETLSSAVNGELQELQTALTWQ